MPARPDSIDLAAVPGSLTLQPIGVVHCDLRDRLQAPRQSTVATGIEGMIELYPASGIEHALEDLASFRHIWVLFWFHKNRGFRPKVLPPRSLQKRGVFATRSPYRPNPLGMSAVELLAIDGLCLRVRNLDMLDGTPVLDLKPYLAYADAIATAHDGWLEGARERRDPLPDYAVEFAPEVEARLRFLEAHGVALRAPIVEVLRLGPQPHAYRRIRKRGSGFRLAYKEWRLGFTLRADARAIQVEYLESGYRPRELFRPSADGLGVHRAFVEHFRH